MTTHNSSNPKIEALRQHASLNPKPDAVNDKLFISNEFFDPCDLLQVKYEIVRRVRLEAQPINQVAQKFGFSRPTVYQALHAFEKGGLAALLPRRPGPRHAHKLSEEIVNFLVKTLAEEPGLKTVNLVSILWDRFELSVYPSSVERALRRHKKKLR